MANICGIGTVKAATERLIGQGLVELVRLAVRGQFTPNEYRLRTDRTITQEGPRPTPLLGNCSVYAHLPTSQEHDAFCRRGLGPTAAVVWDSLAAYGPATAAELARRTGRGLRSIQKACKAMNPVIDSVTGEAIHMLTKTGATYAAREDIDLDVIARLLHVDGEGRRRHERHLREQEQHSRSWQEARARPPVGT
jgi:hypothetical protein